jgi:apolipoprotein N-acyltransferase
MWQTLAVVLMVGLTFLYGHFRLSKEEANRQNSARIRSVVIQGNIDQSVKWDPKFQAQTLDTYLQLTLSASDFKPDLIVWPETATPFYFQDDAELSPRVISLARETGSGLLFGSPAYMQTGGSVKYYNRAYLVSTGIRPLQYYDKMHLVPFGEYVPLKNFLWFVDRLVPAAGDFTPGDEINPMKHGNVSFGPLICFEAIFPELARAHAEKGAQVLINLTNDAWFGKTSAPHQHLAMAVFRTVENRMPMIRAANTGFSGFIGQQGKIIEKSNLFCEETLATELQVPESPLTFYARFGDLFLILLSTVALIKVFSFFKQRWID